VIYTGKTGFLVPGAAVQGERGVKFQKGCKGGIASAFPRESASEESVQRSFGALQGRAGLPERRTGGGTERACPWGKADPSSGKKRNKRSHSPRRGAVPENY